MKKQKFNKLVLTKGVVMLVILISSISMFAFSTEKKATSTSKNGKLPNGCGFTSTTRVVWDDETGYVYSTQTTTKYLGGKDKNGKPCPSGLIKSSPTDDQIRKTSLFSNFSNSTYFVLVDFEKPVTTTHYETGKMPNGCGYTSTTTVIYDDETGSVISTTTRTRYHGGKSRLGGKCPQGLIADGPSNGTNPSN